MTDKANPLTPIKNIPESAWKKLSQKKIYFGHQSVGFNIVEGLMVFSIGEQMELLF